MCAASGNTWFDVVCEEYLAPSIRRELQDIVAAAGLSYSFTCHGMEGEVFPMPEPSHPALTFVRANVEQLALVIAALTETASERVSAFLAKRSILPRKPEAAIDFLGTGEGTVAVFSGNNIKLNCSVVFDNGRQMSAVVIVQIEGGDEPYQVLSWHEIDASASYAKPE